MAKQAELKYLGSKGAASIRILPNGKPVEFVNILALLAYIKRHNLQVTVVYSN